MNLNAQGIYVIVNMESSKVYVGSTACSFRGRWSQHESELRRGVHHSPHLQHAWNLYGEVAFKFQVCEYVEDNEQLHIREQYWLDFHRMLTEVYNTGLVARHSMLGRKRTAETCAKISKAKMGHQDRVGYTHSEETRLKMSRAARGKRHSGETRRRIGRAHAGHYPSFIHRDTGEVIPAGVNLSKMCRKRGLHVQNMCRVANGEASHHKGWAVNE